MSDRIESGKRVLSERDRLAVRSMVIGDVVHPARAPIAKAVLVAMADGVADQESIEELTLYSSREVSQAIEMLRAVGLIDNEGVCMAEVETVDREAKRELLQRLIATKPDAMASMFNADTVEMCWARVRAAIGYRDVHEAVRTIELQSVEVRGENVSGSVLKSVLRAVVDCDGVVEELPRLTSLSMVTCRRSLDALSQIGLIAEPKEKQVQIELQAVADYRPVGEPGKLVPQCA